MALLKRLVPLLAVLLLPALPVFALPVLPGGAVVNPTGTTSAADPEQAGLILTDGTIDYTVFQDPGSPLLRVFGVVQNRVIESAVTGNMIFAPILREPRNLIANTSFGITGFRVTGYAGWDVDVDFRTDALGDKGFTDVARTADGDRMTFLYGDPLRVDSLAPGLLEESLPPAIKTNARAFQFTGTMDIFGQFYDPTGTFLDGPTFTTTITGLAVPAAVPLPAGLMLMLSALAGLIGLRRLRAS
jgi:hypothetical protein